MQFIYLGFTQQANVRRFRFQGVLAPDGPAKGSSATFELFLTADMALLTEHRVRVQEGPALCLHILTAALAGTPEDIAPFKSYQITNEDAREFASGRNAIEDANAARRKSRSPFKPLNPPDAAP